MAKTANCEEPEAYEVRLGEVGRLFFFAVQARILDRNEGFFH